MVESENTLESYFEAGRATAPEVPSALLRRIEVDAAASQGRGAAEVAPAVSKGWRGVLAVLGGWHAGAGLAAAAVAGLAIGAALDPGRDAFGVTFLAGESFDLDDLAPGYGVAVFGGS